MLQRERSNHESEASDTTRRDARGGRSNGESAATCHVVSERGEIHYNVGRVEKIIPYIELAVKEIYERRAIGV